MKRNISLAKAGIRNLGVPIRRKNLQHFQVRCSHIFRKLSKGFDFGNTPASCQIRDDVDRFAIRLLLVEGKYVAARIIE